MSESDPATFFCFCRERADPAGQRQGRGRRRNPKPHIHIQGKKTVRSASSRTSVILKCVTYEVALLARATMPPTLLSTGDDSHGDRHPATALQAKSTLTDSPRTKQIPDPESPTPKLPGRTHLSPSRSSPREIEEGPVPAPAGSAAGTTTEEQWTTSAEQCHQQAVGKVAQVSQAVNILLPDLAREIQQQQDFNSGRGGSGLETKEGEGDPLTCDLIQRLSCRMTRGNPARDSEFMGDPKASSTSTTAVMAIEKKRFSKAEKGKRIATTPAAISLPAWSDQTTSLRPRVRHRATDERILLHGESSKTWQVKGNQSPAFHTDSRQWNREHSQFEQNRHAGSQPPKDNTDEQGFQPVKPAYWWRKERLHSRDKSYPQQPDSSEQRRQRYREHTRGKCLNCFSTEHRAAGCSSASKCWRCLRSGHKAHSCPTQHKQVKRAATEQRSSFHYTASPFKTAPAHQALRLADRSYLQATKGEEGDPSMATYPGDPRARPELAHCTISANGNIKRKREELVGKTAVCWLNGNSHDSKPHHVVEALDSQLHIDRHEIRVVKHYPEQYLVFFADSRAYQRVLQRQAIRDRGRVFNFDQWTERRGAVVRQLEYRVRLRIEGVPVHAWSEETVAQVISPNCSIHYVEGQARRRDRTRTYDLWAWSSNPSKIPKRVLLTITNPDRDHTAADATELYYDPPRDLKGALAYTLHIHLDVVEDLSFLCGRGGRDGPGNRKPRREFLWNYGEMDSRGERRNGQGHDDRASRDYLPRRDRDDHDDNFSRGVRRHRSQSSWGRVTRCRGAMEDCYSSSHFRGGNSGYNGHRSRMGTWRPKAITRRVTFANPLTQILGLPSKEQRIHDMLDGAHGWDHIHSPTAETQHVPKPFNGMKMEAIRTLVEQGNQPKKNKKKGKVTPLATEVMQSMEALQA